MIEERKDTLRRDSDKPSRFAAAARLSRRGDRFCRALLAALAVCIFAGGSVAQRKEGLPSAEKLIGHYSKALGGKRAAGAIYLWRIAGSAQGTVTTRFLRPSYFRADLELNGDERRIGVNGNSAWVSIGHTVHTLADDGAKRARLWATLGAMRFAEFKKAGIRAQTVGRAFDGGELVYIVEFTSRDGARVRCSFSARSGLLLKTLDEIAGLSMSFSDYRTVNGGLEPHRVEVWWRGTPYLALDLVDVKREIGLERKVFDPPQDETFDFNAFLRQAERNQEELERRISEYTFTLKETRREVDGRGNVKKETVRVYEVYPLLGPKRLSVRKLVSEDGVPLSPDRAAKEEARVAGIIARAEREKEKRDGTQSDDEFKITDFFKVCEMVSPRYEDFRGRRTLVFDFRPRPDYRPRNRVESVIARLGGTIWIDVEDKQVARLEARLLRDFKIGGGLIASFRPGAAIVFEQTRLPEGVWLPRFAEFNIAARLFLFSKVELNSTLEYGDYRRFNTRVEGVKIETVKP